MRKGMATVRSFLGAVRERRAPWTDGSPEGPGVKDLVDRIRPHAPSIYRGAIIAVVSGGLVFLLVKERPEWLGLTPPRAAFQSRPTTAAPTVTALGRLEPETEIVEISVAPGSRIDRLLIKEGDHVESGAPLAFLDAHGEMVAARDLAATQLDEAQSRYKVETAHGGANVTAARLKVRQAEEASLRLVEAQEAVVRAAQAARDKARLDLDRAERLLKEGVVSASEHDGVSLAARQTVEQLVDQEATLARVRTNFDLDLQTARAELLATETGLTQAQLALQVASLRDALKLADARLERTVVRAPFAGEILKILTHAGESVGKYPLLKMGNTAAMFVVAEVYETDAGLVRRGQRAVVTSKAFPDQKIGGRVERISSLIHKKDVLGVDPTSDADARVVEARIRLDESGLAARFNQLQVDVSIAVDAR
jgi:HlyD family secretion protein